VEPDFLIEDLLGVRERRQHLVEVGDAHLDCRREVITDTQERGGFYTRFFELVVGVVDGAVGQVDGAANALVLGR
jgi:hypothetical protein